ncbi:histidine phosphatase superfamily [Umbelopsis sp. PMI_123]|nr:histidine phosphatase superfamily [Umbelopsis sp. PMI_123]
MIYFYIKIFLWAVVASTLSSASVLQTHIHGPSRLDWIKQHLATKSPYTSGPQNINSAGEPDCEVLQYHSVIRHGTRWPTAKNTATIKDVVSRLFTSSSDKVNWLIDWDDPFIAEKAGYLHIAGQYEMYAMGQRIAKRYKRLLENIDLDTDELQFASDAQSRTSRSGSAFHLGLLEQTGNLTSAFISPTAWSIYPKANDSYIHMGYTCPRWVSEVSTNPNATYQAQLWIDTMIPPIATRLSAELGVELTTDNVEAIYAACAFETSFFQTYSDWCTLLNQDDILTFEYAEDLEHYYKFSYGYEINQWVATDLMKMLMQMLESNKAPKMTFQFGHSQTILFFQTFLNLNKDKDILRASTPIGAIRQRKFRTSKLSPFAANIAFELHDCSGTQYIRTLFSEREIILPCCELAMCPFDQFKSWINEKIAHDYDMVCKL